MNFWNFFAILAKVHLQHKLVENARIIQEKRTFNVCTNSRVQSEFEFQVGYSNLIKELYFRTLIYYMKTVVKISVYYMKTKGGSNYILKLIDGMPLILCTQEYKSWYKLNLSLVLYSVSIIKGADKFFRKQSINLVKSNFSCVNIQIALLQFNCVKMCQIGRNSQFQA